ATFAADALPGGQVNALLPGAAGRDWVCTSGGLAVLTPKFAWITGSDGLSGDWVVGGVALADKVWFGIRNLDYGPGWVDEYVDGRFSSQRVGTGLQALSSRDGALVLRYESSASIWNPAAGEPGRPVSAPRWTAEAS